MTAITLLIFEFILSVLAVFCGFPAWTSRNGVVVSFGNVFAIVLMILLALQVFGVLR